MGRRGLSLISSTILIMLLSTLLAVFIVSTVYNIKYGRINTCETAQSIVIIGKPVLILSANGTNSSILLVADIVNTGNQPVEVYNATIPSKNITLLANETTIPPREEVAIIFRGMYNSSTTLLSQVEVCIYTSTGKITVTPVIVKP